MNNKVKLYAVVFNGESRLFDNWDDCSNFVKGKSGVKYKKFASEQEANAWIMENLSVKTTFTEVTEKVFDPSIIYFDAGTGRGIGVEVRVTDSLGNSLINKIASNSSFIDLCNRYGFIVNDFGNVQLPKNFTNNYGEALGCILAYKIANMLPEVKTILGDSELVIKYWSNGVIKVKNESTVKMLKYLTDLRASSTLELKWIPGSANMADLGFHKD